ncbi:UNVERIFIED_CONTAM: hypothetical protein PYX00_011427 [Menopon gallinae]|uniref:RNA polymerase II subunit A C-terminal domain phosphatase SSU72 n=1 Tax=Menopon gallinae TaxID=328185 RepID=A0AAW2H7Y3_9NEOP
MKIAVVCAMNQNRSMEAHYLLRKEGYDVRSYGTNPVIKLPGPSIVSPNEYTYATTYQEIHTDLVRKDERLYQENGLLMLMERNMQIKERPEYFFDGKDTFDLVITCEEKCFTAVFDHYTSRRCAPGRQRCYLVNFDVNDTQQDAICGSQEIAGFVAYLSEYGEDDLEESMLKVLDKYMKNSRTQLLFSVVDC